MRDRLERRGVELGSLLVALTVGPSVLADGLGGIIPGLSEMAGNTRASSLAAAEIHSIKWGVAVRSITGVIVLTGIATGIVVGFQPGVAPGPSATTQSPPSTNPELPSGAELRLGSAAPRHPDILTHLRFSKSGDELVSYGHGKVRLWDAKTGAPLHPTQALHDIKTTVGTTFLSPDGNKLIAPHFDTNPIRFSVREYDLATGKHKELFEIPERIDPDGKIRPIGSQQFLLTPDGTLLIEGYGEEAYLWELTSGKLRHHFKFPGKLNHQFLFTPDSKQLLTAGSEGPTIRVWDTTTGKETRVLSRNGSSSVTGRLAISRDGRWVAAVENSYLDGTGTRMIIWDLNNSTKFQLATLTDGFGFGELAFGPDGMLYVISNPPMHGPRAIITKWNAATGERLARWADLFSTAISFSTVAISQDGKSMAIGSHSGVIRSFETQTGKELIHTDAHSSAISEITFNPAGTEIRTVSRDGEVRTWDATKGNQRSYQTTFNPSVDKTDGSQYSRDGRWVVSYRLNPEGPFPPWPATLWDAVAQKKKFDWGIDGRVTGLVEAPGGKLLVGYLESRSGYLIRVWDIATGEPKPGINRVFNLSRDRDAIFSDGKTVLMIDENLAEAFDLESGRLRFTWQLSDHDVLGQPLPKDDKRPGLVRAVAASSDGKTLAIAIGGPAFLDVTKRTDNLVLVEMETGKVIRRVKTPETHSEWLAFSPDGRWIVGQTCVWEVATLKEVRRFPPHPGVTSAGFSSDGKRVATGHVNGTAMVWPIIAP
jgi:WD40 repeat protein